MSCSRQAIYFEDLAIDPALENAGGRTGSSSLMLRIALPDLSPASEITWIRVLVHREAVIHFWWGLLGFHC